MAESNLLTDEIQNRLQQLAKNWDELRQKAAERGQRLEESLTYQQFAASIEEEEAWIMEKQHLLSGDDCGDTLAAVQGLLKKHGAFETDFKVHEDRCTEITGEGDKLIEAVSTVFYFSSGNSYISTNFGSLHCLKFFLGYPHLICKKVITV